MKDNYFLVLGKSKRMLACADRLNALGYAAVCREADEFEQSIKDFKNFILPLPSLKDGFISGTNLTFEHFCSLLTEDCTVFCGNVSLQSFPCRAFSYYENENFIAANSRLTAQGTLRLVLENTEKDMNALKIAVIGYGRCGREICGLLKSSSADVIPFSRRTEAENDALKPDRTENISLRLNEFDIIINTVPCNIIDRDALRRLTQDNIYIEIASEPYGFNTEDADDFNFRYIPAGGLPGRFTPVSAGSIIADTVISMIKE